MSERVIMPHEMECPGHPFGHDMSWIDKDGFARCQFCDFGTTASALLNQYKALVFQCREYLRYGDESPLDAIKRNRRDAEQAMGMLIDMMRHCDPPETLIVSPREPTKEMLHAGYDEAMTQLPIRQSTGHKIAREVYKAMTQVSQMHYTAQQKRGLADLILSMRDKQRELEDQLARYIADAERYQWLTSNAANVWSGDQAIEYLSNPSAMTAAIDALRWLDVESFSDDEPPAGREIDQ